jgi:hypothetical protein
MRSTPPDIPRLAIPTPSAIAEDDQSEGDEIAVDHPERPQRAGDDGPTPPS